MNKIDSSHPALAPWIGSAEVIAERWSDKAGNLLVITKLDDYALLRAFHLAGKVVVSVDVSNASADTLLATLLLGSA